MRSVFALTWLLALVAGPAVADPGPASADRATLLAQFQYEAEPFPFKKVRVNRIATFDTYRVEMPSPIESGVDSNDTVYGYYYKPRMRTNAAVIVLPIAAGKDLTLEQSVAIYLAHRGFKAFVMPMPYQQERGRDLKVKNVLKLDGGLETFTLGVRQAVMDVKRVRQWLVEKENVDAGRVGLVGISLGSLCASIVHSTDPGFKAAALVLSGGDMAKVIWHGSKETIKIKNEIIAQGKDYAWTEATVRPMDPLTYATPERGKGVYMVNAEQDEVFPFEESSKKLQKAYGDPPMMVLPGDHYSVAVFIPVVLEGVAKHMRKHLLGKE